MVIAGIVSAVLTTSSNAVPPEALETFQRFPAISGVVLDSGLEDLSCRKVAQTIKQARPSMPVIVISSPDAGDCPEADFQLESFEPAKLLEVLKGLEKKASAEIEKRNEELSRDK